MLLTTTRLFFASALLLLVAAPAWSDALGAMERVLAFRFAVPQITPQALAAIPPSQRPLLFDVRAADEFAVSHLPGAIQINPTRDGEGFLRRYATSLQGRTAVFYCTVGARSSRLAADVLAHLTSADSVTVYNLRGGIFRWQAARLPLENSEGPTEWVHPYDDFWARLAPRAERQRYISPGSTPSPSP